MKRDINGNPGFMTHLVIRQSPYSQDVKQVFQFAPIGGGGVTSTFPWLFLLSTLPHQMAEKHMPNGLFYFPETPASVTCGECCYTIVGNQLHMRPDHVCRMEE